MACVRTCRPCQPSWSELSKKVVSHGSPSSSSFRLSDLSSSSSTKINEQFTQSLGSDLYNFQLSELRAITQSFSVNYLLGEGGFGTVHKGCVDDKLQKGLKAQAVAVKLLDIEGLQGHREWLAEVIFLGQLRHQHLGKLISYCCEEEERLLVYGFMLRGSLENHLFRSMLAYFSVAATEKEVEDRHRSRQKPSLLARGRNSGELVQLSNQNQLVDHYASKLPKEKPASDSG